MLAICLISTFQDNKQHGDNMAVKKIQPLAISEKLVQARDAYRAAEIGTKLQQEIASAEKEVTLWSAGEEKHRATRSGYHLSTFIFLVMLGVFLGLPLVLPLDEERILLTLSAFFALLFAAITFGLLVAARRCLPKIKAAVDGQAAWMREVEKKRAMKRAPEEQRHIDSPRLTYVYRHAAHAVRLNDGIKRWNTYLEGRRLGMIELVADEDKICTLLCDARESSRQHLERAAYLLSSNNTTHNNTALGYPVKTEDLESAEAAICRVITGTPYRIAAPAQLNIDLTEAEGELTAVAEALEATSHSNAHHRAV